MMGARRGRCVGSADSKGLVDVAMGGAISGVGSGSVDCTR